jgi:opacity protein-like surface antigen
MKRIALLLVVLPFLLAAVNAQESRQDVSASITGIGHIDEPVAGDTNVQLTTHKGMGALFSYRYMLTPRSALEVNYQYLQNANHYDTNPTNSTSYPGVYRVHTRIQEVSAAYVFNFNFRHWNPFLELGGGGYFFAPIANGTSILDLKSKTSIGALYGAGVSYEISPSFDVRLEYRGIFLKTPDFGSTAPNLSTGKYYNLSNPVLGVAYHF